MDDADYVRLVNGCFAHGIQLCNGNNCEMNKHKFAHPLLPRVLACSCEAWIHHVALSPAKNVSPTFEAGIHRHGFHHLQICKYKCCEFSVIRDEFVKTHASLEQHFAGDDSAKSAPKQLLRYKCVYAYTGTQRHWLCHHAVVTFDGINCANAGFQNE